MDDNQHQNEPGHSHALRYWPKIGFMVKIVVNGGLPGMPGNEHCRAGIDQTFPDTDIPSLSARVASLLTYDINKPQS